jgi:sec-independent protein translocase protein TatA
MFDVGGGELLLIILVIILLFGPNKLPEIASMVGKGMRKVREAQDEITQHVRDISTDMERSTEPTQLSSEQSQIVQPTDVIPDPTIPMLNEHSQMLSSEDTNLTNMASVEKETTTESVSDEDKPDTKSDKESIKLTTLALAPKPPDNSVAR